MSILNRVKAYEEAAAATASGRPGLHSPRTSLTFSSDDALTAASSSAPASPNTSSVLDDLDSFVLTGTPSSTSASPTRPNVPPPIPSKPKGVASLRMTPHTPPRKFTSPNNTGSSETVQLPPEVKVDSAFSSPTRGVTPPLPPRRNPSDSSINSTSKAHAPPLPKRASNNGTATHNRYPPVPLRSDSLTITPTAHTSRHAHASSTSSFQSLSLSDNGDKDEVTPTEDSTVTSAATSLSSDGSSKKRPPLGDIPLRKPGPLPPKLPARTPSGSSTSSGPSIPRTGNFFTQPAVEQRMPYKVRRTAPIPPPRPSQASPVPGSKPPIPTRPGAEAAAASGRRKAPVPPPARARYEALFDRNLQKPITDFLAPSPTETPRPPPRSRVGWRGTSMDLRSGSAPDPPVDLDNRLSGTIVKKIWICSKLERKFLKNLWVECDTDAVGHLDRESFVQGMWRIDEELARRRLVRTAGVRR